MSLSRGISRCRRAMALLVVVLTIAALAILATPFMVSMRLQERSSRSAIAATRARYAVNAAFNHAIAQLLRATNEYGEMAVSFAALPPEFVWRKGQRSMMLAARVEEEQGKLNLNAACEGVMAALFADAEVGLGLSRAAAEQLAAAVAQYRETSGPLPMLEELVARGAVSVEQLNALRRHATVHSLTDEGGLARVNINTCSTAVLRAALSGIRLRFVEPVADPANRGDGAMPVVAISDTADGVWEVRCTDVQTDPNTDAKTFTFTAESYPENDPSDRTTEGGFSLVELPNQPGGVHPQIGTKALFSIYNGAKDFAVGDKFTFSAERFSYNRAKFSPDKVNALLKRFRAVVVSADASAGTITLDGLLFPASGWVRIQGDLIRYTSRDGYVLQGCTDIAAAPEAGATAALVVADMAELDGILAAAVADGDIRESDRAAIVANAKDPANPCLLNATVGFCFRPSGRYLIEAEGLVNDAAGRLEARASARRIVALDRGAAGVWTLNTQGDFDAQIATSGRDGLITRPGASYVSDVPPSGGAGNAGISLLPIQEGGDGWGFDGPTLFGATNWAKDLSSISFVPPVLGMTLRDKLFVNGDKGLWVGGTHAFRAFGTRDLLAVDGTLRRLVLWVKPGESFAYNANHTFFDSGLANMSDAADFHTNRILLSYQSNGTLLFRIADEARENRSAEIRAPVTAAQFAIGAWHRIEALWSGMEIGRMALMLDGRLVGTYSPSGAAAEAKASPSLTGEKWIARVANHLRQEGDGGSAVRDTQIGSTTAPKSVYGYGACTFINKDASTRKTVFDRVHRGGARLGEKVENALVTTLKIKQLPPPAPPVTLLPDALVIPVADATGFPKQGYVKIDDKEIVRYTDWTYNAADSCYELTVPPDGRGCDFGDNLATRYTTEPAEHANGRQVVCISIRVTDNSMYPMPRLLDVPADIENYFGLTGLDPSMCMVQVDDEWIAYTHRAGTEFLVHVQAKAATRNTSETETITTSSMRGAGGTYVATHANGANVLPVYEVAPGGRMGGGDRITLLDDDLAPQEAVEMVLHRVSGSAVSFADFLPDGLNLCIKKGTTARNARMVKFPSGRFRPQRFVSIGAPMSGAGGRAESTIGCVRLYEHSSSTAQRIKEPVTSGTSLLVFGSLGALYNGGTEWPWLDSDFGVGSWPLCGYVKIGDEAFLYKVRYPHNIGYSQAVGAVSQSASATVRGAIAATGNVVWQRQGVEDDPIKLGFNPYGGYMMITSYKRTATSGTTRSLNGCSNEILQWLIQQGYVTQQYVDANGTQNPDGTWNFPDIVTPGGWSTSESREFIFYSDLSPKTPGADEYTFTCETGRHLYNTHMDGAIPLGHEPADDGEGGTIYPRLTARTVALAILQRGGAAGTLALGTTRTDHAAGSALLPLPNVSATILSGPPRNKDGTPAAPFEGDMLPVESTDGFPERGYLEITNAAGTREIIYYTGKGSEKIPGSDPERRRYFFTGIRNFRGRFGTTPIDLSGLSDLSDVRDTSDAALAECRRAERVVRLFQPRFHDRMPLRITMAGGIEQSRDYAPHAADIDVLCFEAKKTVRGAKWLSLDWTEELPEGTDIVVLARVGGSPDWATAPPVRWNQVPASGARVIYKFDTPGEGNTINARGDTIVVRVFFKFNPGYDLSRWQVPVLKSLTVQFEAGPSVLESQVLD